MIASFCRWIRAPHRFVLAMGAVALVYLGLTAWAHGIHSQPGLLKWLVTVLALIPTVPMLACARFYWPREHEQSSPKGSEDPSKHGQSGGALDDAVKPTALWRCIAWTAASVVGATLVLAALWIESALQDLGLYQLLVSVVMLSTIAVGFVHLTYAKSNLMKQSNRTEGSRNWSCPAMTDTFPLVPTKEVSHGGKQTRAVSARVQGADRGAREGRAQSGVAGARVRAV